MRLATKFFLASALGILVLGIGTLGSLLAVSHLVAVNQAVTTRTAPALRLEAQLADSVQSLIRLERRHALLKDPGYKTLWEERITRTRDDLAALSGALTTDAEIRRQRSTTAALRAYESAFGTAAATEVGERLRRHIARLTDATHRALAGAERRASALEQSTRHAVAVALPASILVALAATGWLAGRIRHTLRLLRTATAEVAEGRFGETIDVSRRDEIGELARSLQGMAVRLGEAERLKEEFFAHISHELRTPLTAMREATNLLRDRAVGPLTPKQERLLEIVAGSTERLLGLVNQILELSWLRAGLGKLQHGRVDLGRLVTRVLEELRPQAEARGLAIARGGAGAGVVVLGDEERLLEVLMNLVGNAVKHTPPGGTVRVDLGRRDGEVEIAVADTGAGIPRDALPRIFDRYWRTRGKGAGTGLGLAIVKSIVEAHGGRVDAESEVGRGSRFTVRLPHRGLPA